MKTSTVLVVAVAAVLSVAAGCQTSPKITKLPDASGSGSKSASTQESLDSSRLSTANSTVNGAEVSSTDLPNEDKLAGRDLDRSTFADQTVYFEYDRSNVRANEASKLDQVAGAFKAKGADYDLLIEGHCDERGTEEYNRALGERRALAVRELLIKSGVDANHVFTRSFGKDKPANVGHDETAWSRNRRGEFVLVLPKKITTTQNTQ
jgi:peptidoglycan-associated lipoprotein